MMTRDKALGRTIAIDRLTSGFEYVGPAMDRLLAKSLLAGVRAEPGVLACDVTGGVDG